MIALLLLAASGAINPTVTQANIATTICVHGWTKTIRPPASYTNKLKLQQMKQMGLTGSPRAYEEDHLVSLEAGGNPIDPNNLWPQPWNGPHSAHHKDRLENRVHKLICSGKITLSQGQHMLSDDWVASYRAQFGSEP